MRTIKIENCNSIESAEIQIAEGVLNIKYGPNGLGKSTIARSIISSVANDGSLQGLKPFKYRGVPGEHDPSVQGVEDIGSVLVFDMGRIYKDVREAQQNKEKADLTASE